MVLIVKDYKLMIKLTERSNGFIFFIYTTDLLEVIDEIIWQVYLIKIVLRTGDHKQIK